MPSIDLNKIKTASKKKSITVNDIIMCALTTSLNSLFEKRKEKVDSVTLMIPANIRFKFYETREDVKLENKFAAIPLKVPVTKTME